MTTVACLFVRGEYPYTPEYVTRLYAMVKRHLSRPFRFVCLTDHPWLFTAPVMPIEVTRLAGFAYWTKLELFNPTRDWSGRMLYLDLDTLIVADLDPIVDAPADFAITADPWTPRSKPRDKHGREIIRRFNSSVMVWEGGTQTHLYEDWRPSIAKQLSGDQDWIGLNDPEAYALPREWFPRLSECVSDKTGFVGWPGAAKVVLSKVPKNHIAAEQWPWFEQVWRAA